jgi:phosphoribosyl 1,2-cyclic phosphate phosphodiesterase
MKVTVLGCGASGGVPLIGCKCPVCLSDNPKNTRTRASIFIESEGTRVLVDTGPDMREQCLRHDICKVDAIIYTHAHADHLHGIDDIRSFNYANNAPVKAYSDALTLTYIQEKFSYCFLPPQPESPGWYRPCIVPVEVAPMVPFRIGAMEILAFEQQHGRGKSLGLRIGNFAYSTDTNGLSEVALQVLAGVETWIVDCLRYEPAPTHAHLEMTLGWIAEVNPRRAYLTHLNHGFEYEAFAAELPNGTFPAYDGLILEI